MAPSPAASPIQTTDALGNVVTLGCQNGGGNGNGNSNGNGCSGAGGNSSGGR